MGGYADDWTALLFMLVLLWWVCGPFVMAGLGVWCGRARGGSRTKARIASFAVPVAVMAAPVIARFKPDDVMPSRGDVIGFFAVELGLLTVLPWLLGYGAVRFRAARPKG
ncbi:hypothetical protein [Streptomyces sp. NPDC088762]|uniref:hypothetical protein n=1 Tax=Streptomyces sp. NPDC088762 TaxID=3365891 RepID=UPI00381730BB